MTKNDDLILEFLHEHELALPPRAIEYNLRNREQAEISYSTINRRLRKILEAGLVKREYEEAGFYSITEMGRDYLSGDLDAEDLEEPT